MSSKPFIAVNNSGEGTGMDRRQPESVAPRQEGQTRYPGERTESRTPITDAMRKVLSEIAIEARDGKPVKTGFRVLAESILARALSDNPQSFAAIKEIIARVKGPISTEIYGSDGRVVRITIERVYTDKDRNRQTG